MAQSSKSQPKPDEAQTASPSGAAEGEILDAEIISEQTRPARPQAQSGARATGGTGSVGSGPETSAGSERSGGVGAQAAGFEAKSAVQKPKSSLLTRLALVVCFLLAAFIGGVFAEPYVHTSLTRLGLVEEAALPSADGPVSGNIKAELESAKVALAEQKRLASTLALRVSALEDAHTDLAGTSGLPSGQIDAASIDTLTSRLSDLEDRFSQVANTATRTGPADSVPNAGAIGSPASSVGLPSVSTGEAEAFKRLVGDFEASRTNFQAALADYSARLSALEAARLEADTRTTEAEGALASTEARVPALAARQAGLEATTRQLAGEQLALSARLARLEEQAASLAGTSLVSSAAGRLVLMLADVRQRALAGQPVASDLAAMQSVVGQLAEVQQMRVQPLFDSLSVLLVAPLASQADLLSHYDMTLKAASDARAARDGEFLAGLLRVRRTGAAAEGFDKIVAEARTHLAAGRLTQARDALSALKAEELADFSTWLKSLDRRMSAELMLTRAADILARTDVDAQMDTEVRAEPAHEGIDTPTSPQGERQP